jgi:hypothetical protein
MRPINANLFSVTLPLAAWNHLRDTRIDGTPVHAELDVPSDCPEHDSWLQRWIAPIEAALVRCGPVRAPFQRMSPVTASSRGLRVAQTQ